MFLVSSDSQLTSTSGGGDGKYRFKCIPFTRSTTCNIFGASVSEPHTSESNWDFSYIIIGASVSEPNTSLFNCDFS